MYEWFDCHLPGCGRFINYLFGLSLYALPLCVLLCGPKIHNKRSCIHRVFPGCMAENYPDFLGLKTIDQNASLEAELFDLTLIA